MRRPPSRRPTENWYSRVPNLSLYLAPQCTRNVSARCFEQVSGYIRTKTKFPKRRQGRKRVQDKSLGQQDAAVRGHHSPSRSTRAILEKHRPCGRGSARLAAYLNPREDGAVKRTVYRSPTWSTLGTSPNTGSPTACARVRDLGNAYLDLWVGRQTMRRPVQPVCIGPRDKRFTDPYGRRPFSISQTSLSLTTHGRPLVQHAAFDDHTRHKRSLYVKQIATQSRRQLRAHQPELMREPFSPPENLVRGITCWPRTSRPPGHLKIPIRCFEIRWARTSLSRRQGDLPYELCAHSYSRTRNRFSGRCVIPPGHKFYILDLIRRNPSPRCWRRG